MNVTALNARVIVNAVNWRLVMRLFQINWRSDGNIETGTVIVKATDIVQAQDKFWRWLRLKPIYQHMWNLSFTTKEIEENEVIE